APQSSTHTPSFLLPSLFEFCSTAFRPCHATQPPVADAPLSALPSAAAPPHRSPDRRRSAPQSHHSKPHAAHASVCSSTTPQDGRRTGTQSPSAAGCRSSPTGECAPTHAPVLPPAAPPEVK